MRYFLTVNKPIPFTPLLREYFNPFIIWPLVLIPVFRLSVEARIRYYTCGILNRWYMYTHPYIHSSNENSRVDSSWSSSQGAWLAESRSAFTRILAHQPPGQLPLPYPLEPGSGEDVRATRGQHLSAAESREQRNPSSPSFPLALHFLPSHLPSSLALLFLFSHFPSPPRKPHPHLNPQPLKFSLFMAWNQKWWE